MRIQLSPPTTPLSAPPLLTIMGHVGVGHVHSIGGMLQDDSAGFSVAVSLIRSLLPVDLRVRSVEADHRTGIIRVTTMDGGSGEASPRRGFSRHEAEIMQRAVGENALFTQPLAVKTLGRMRGQGADETPVSFQTALALAVTDTFAKRHGGSVLIEPDGLPGSCGCAMGVKAEINARPVALVATINASPGGTGPMEDNEGNLAFCGKRTLLDKLGGHGAPAVVIESKVYVPGRCAHLERPVLLIRSQRGVDNDAVAAALYGAALSLAYPALKDDDAFPRGGHMRAAKHSLVRHIKALAEELGRSDRSWDKVRIIAELNRLCSEDAGGVTFMSDSVHEVAGNSGIVPATAAVLSMLCPAGSVYEHGMPLLDPADLFLYENVILKAAADILDSQAH